MRRLEEIEDLTRRVYDGMRRGDLERVSRAISRQDGLVWIGTDATQWWTSHETMVRVLHHRTATIGLVDIVETDPRGFGEGDVAWVADQPVLRLVGGEDLPVRLTAIAHREDGAWRFVQWHLSAGRAPGAGHCGTTETNDQKGSQP